MCVVNESCLNMVGLYKCICGFGYIGEVGNCKGN